KSENPSEDKNTPAPKSENPSEDKKTPAPKSEKPSEDKKNSAQKSEKPSEDKKNPAPKSEKPSEDKKTPAPKSEKPSEDKKNPPEKKEKNKAALKNAGKKLHSSEKDKEKKDDKIKVKEESIDNIKKMFDGALGEDSGELAELVTEEPAVEMPAVRAVNKSKLYFLFGLAVSVFAVIGVISTVWFSAREIKAFTDNTQQKDELARFIYPVVICDPAPFDLTMKLHNDTALSAALWDIILYEDKSKYEHDFDYIIVPEVDVEKHAVKLFGEGMSFVHKSLLNSEVKFYYEEDLKSYRIPSKPRYFTYSPLVESIERDGENYTLTVGYISPTPSYFALNTENAAPTPDKYVEYVVNKHGDEYTLIEINISDKGRDPNLGL
ncbi:MAG: hypothetical protein IJZ72_09185, partial [Oscillospiraceae bacterium]|nr:hypothetical protein [Oscillospiraceae bacterium]